MHTRSHFYSLRPQIRLDLLSRIRVLQASLFVYKPCIRRRRKIHAGDGRGGPRLNGLRSARERRCGQPGAGPRVFGSVQKGQH